MLALFPFLKGNTGLARLLTSAKGLPHTPPMPVFFVGHIDMSKHGKTTPFTSSLRAMGETVQPAAILVISAHWLTLGDTCVNLNPQFHTPEYTSKGSPETGKLIIDSIDATGNADRELDHGAWSVLRHISPTGNIPVLEMSIDMEKPLDYHYNIAQQLKRLRSRGVLIVGSGNIVHNLELSALRIWTRKPYERALEFDEWAKRRIMEKDLGSLFQYYKPGKVADYAVPTMDHYLPMLYCLSLCDQQEEITWTYEEVTRGLSLRCFRIG